MEAILANASQHAPPELLHACGYKDRLTAQKSLVSNAALLYDLGYERRQLRRLQGSLLLGAAICSFTTDKDFRYWLHNSVRIATRMGLHKRDIARELDPSTYGLCRRIWWSLYIRDISLSLTGFRNMRMLDSNDCDTDPLTEDDWEEEDVPPTYRSLLSPLTRQQKLWVVESAKLAAIGERCLSVLRNQAQPQAENSHSVLSADDDLAAQFASWRAALPTVLLIKPQPQGPNENNVLPIMLMAAVHRYECILYRALLKQHQQARDDDRYVRARQRLKSAMLEIDTLVGRAITEELFPLLHLKFMGSIFTVLALRIESALSPTESDLGKAMAYTYIRQSIMFLRQVRDHDLPTIECTLRLFEWVLDQKGLSAVLDLPRRDSSVGGPLPVLRSTNNAVYQNSNEQPRSGGHPMAPPFVDMLPPTADFANDPAPMFQDLLGFDFLDDLGFSTGI